jgi:transposase
MGGSGHRLPPASTQQLHDYMNAGYNNSAIHKATGVDRKCIRKVRMNLRYWGEAYPPRGETVKLGRPATLCQAHIDALRDYLHGYPQALVAEMMEHLHTQFGVEASYSTIYRALKKLRYSRKVASKHASEQSEPLRRAFIARVQNSYKAEQVVAVDESACNERTGDRKYGWSPQGTPVELVYSMKRSERWSVLPAITMEGYLTFVMFQGAITGEIFESFLLKVLKLLAPGYHVLVMDNASIHQSPRVRDLCADFGVDLEYLPPYSPDYNLIEKSFKVLKSWIKRNWKLAEQFNDFSYFLYFAIEQACCGVDVDVRSWFVMCGYPSDN